MGEDTDTISSAAAAAAARITELSAERRTTTASRSAGPSGRVRPAVSSAPTHLGIVDHMVNCRQEVVEHARAAVPADHLARPVPGDQAAVYAWAAEQAGHMAAEDQRVLDGILRRQALESAVLAGADHVVRPYRCLNCRCFSLHWQPQLRAAVCFNLKCSDQQGRASRFTLTELAHGDVQDFTFRAAT